MQAVLTYLVFASLQTEKIRVTIIILVVRKVIIKSGISSKQGVRDMRKVSVSNQFTIILISLVCIAVANAYTSPNSTTNSSPAKNQLANKQASNKSSEIVQAVKDKLVADKMLKKFSFTVEGYRGMVEVSGLVDNDVEKKRAIEIAQHVYGVRSVSDGVVVKDKK